MTTDTFRALCARMADELDHYQQLLMDDRRETHALATEARAAIAVDRARRPTPHPEPEGRSSDGGYEAGSMWVGHATRQPEPEGLTDEEPMAWLYKGEPDFNGERWRENWCVTTDKQVARFKAQPGNFIPLFRRPTPQPPITPELVLAQREEILAAFIAKHGFDPDSAIQIEQRQEDGTTTWRIERTPQTPADGEVTEVVEFLKQEAAEQHPGDSDGWPDGVRDCMLNACARFTRAAELLERLASDNAGLTAAADSLWADNISLLDGEVAE